MKRFFLTLTMLILLSSAPHAFADPCIDWARVMSKFDVENTPKRGSVVLLQSFEDFTKLPGDDWLATGIPMLIADYLSTGRDVTVLYGPAASYSPLAVSPNYTISGMYQHTQGRLRIFVKLHHAAELKKQWQLDMPYPQNRQFFDTLGETALAILAMLSPHYDNARFAQVKGATAVLPAYENYIRGLATYRTFDPDKADVARTWFEESKKADINYQKAYQGMIDLYTFLAMYNKQNRKSYSKYLELAEKEMTEMERFSARPLPPARPKKYVVKMKDKPLKLTNRYLLANSYFIAGLEASGNKNWREAANQFEFALVHTPEDAITWYHLSKIYDRLGNKQRAAEARAKAFELNRCLQ